MRCTIRSSTMAEHSSTVWSFCLIKYNRLQQRDFHAKSGGSNFTPFLSPPFPLPLDLSCPSWHSFLHSGTPIPQRPRRRLRLCFVWPRSFALLIVNIFVAIFNNKLLQCFVQPSRLKQCLHQLFNVGKQKQGVQ